MIVASVPPRPKAAGPGIAPALRGPTRNAPPSSTHPMLPPPADTVSTTTRGSAIGTPATSPPASTTGSPSRTSPASALVPPMSIVNASLKPARRATYAAPTTPPAGPESASAAALFMASLPLRIPPEDVITEIGGKEFDLSFSSARAR